MASAVTELLSYIASIIGPAAGDPRTAASVRTPLGQLASRSKWLKELLHDRLIGVEKTIESCTVAAPGVFTSTAHGFAANTAIRFFVGTSGVLPTGILADTIYYVDATTADTFKVSLTSGPGALVTTTGAMTGPIFAAAIPDWVTTLLVANATYGYGKITDLVVFLAGAQTITGAKIVSDLTWSGTSNPKVATRSITRAMAVVWVDPATGLCQINPIEVAAGASIWCTFELPNGQTLTDVTISINPDNVGGLPGTPPSINGGAVDVITGLPAGTGFGPIPDPSPNVGVYNATHDISSGVLSEALVTTSRRYEFQFTNGTADPITVNGLRITCSVVSKTHWS